MYPAELFSISESVAPWQIVHLRSRQEKAVARILLQHRQPYYLPQIERTFRSGGRQRVSHLPLFPGYLFVRHSEGLRPALWSTDAVVRILDVTDQLLLAEELRQIQTLQETGAVLTPGPELHPGDPVRITEGVFQGYSGIVIRGREATRLVISISAIGKSVVAEFPRESVTAVRGGDGRQTLKGLAARRP